MTPPYSISLPYNGNRVGVVITNIANMLPHRDNANRTIIHTFGDGYVFVDLPVDEIVKRINNLLDGEDV